MNLPLSSRTNFIQGALAADADLKALNRVRFSPNRGRVLCLLVTLAGTSVTLRPVHRESRSPGQDEVADPPLQFQDPAQDKTFAAAGQFYCEVKVPRDLMTAIAVTAVAGGAVSIVGWYSDDE